MTMPGDELRPLILSLNAMGAEAESMLARALQAVRGRDVALAREVIEADKQLDDMERAIDEAAIRMLALRPPMAMTLRDVIGVLKIAAALERVGDLAKNICRRTLILAEASIGGAYEEKLAAPVLLLGEAAQAQLRDALSAYEKRDLETARKVWERDETLDELYNSLLRDHLEIMTENRQLVPVGAQLLFITKNLERIGDHATSIVEMLHYAITGEPYDSDRPKGARIDEAQIPFADP